MQDETHGNNDRRERRELSEGIFYYGKFTARRDIVFPVGRLVQRIVAKPEGAIHADERIAIDPRPFEVQAAREIRRRRGSGMIVYGKIKQRALEGKLLVSAVFIGA